MPSRAFLAIIVLGDNRGGGGRSAPRSHDILILVLKQNHSASKVSMDAGNFQTQILTVFLFSIRDECCSFHENVPCNIFVK